MITTLMACGATAVVCFSSGTIFGAVTATRGRDDYVARLKRRIDTLKTVNTVMHDELNKLIAERNRLNVQRRAAGEKGRAVQKALRAVKAAEAKAISDARHAEMRDSLGVI